MSAPATATRRLTSPRRRELKPGVPADLMNYPLVCYREHLATIFDRSVRWVELEVRAGRFPIPHLTHLLPTLGWSRADIERFFEARTFDTANAPAPRAAQEAR